MTTTMKGFAMNLHLPLKAGVPDGQALVDGALVEIDPSLAGQLLRETSYSGQRPIDERHALTLGLEMEQGTFLGGTQIAFARFGGHLYLINGRHRLHAVELSGTAISFRLAIYEAASDAEIGNLYCRFDTMQRGRTARQIVGAVGLVDEGEDGLSPSGATLLYAAMPILMLRFERVAHSQRPVETRIVDRKVAAAADWKPAAIVYQRLLDRQLTKFSRRFRASGVVAVALATLRYQPAMAETFWSAATLADGLHVGDPRHTLYLDLIASRRNSGAEYDLAAAAAVAWNAFFGRRQLKIIRVNPGPIVIAGTPFGGDR